MKKNETKRMMATVLCASVAAGMMIGGNQVYAAQDQEEVTTITVYPENANTKSGLVGGYKGDLFARHGIAVEVWSYSDEKTNAIMASGDLPDVMHVSSENLEFLIEEGLVLNLDEYMDKLPNIAENENFAPGLEYAREYKSAGTGKLYGMPTTMGTEVQNIGINITKNMMVVNWDCYEGIGAPEIKDQWQLIDVMKQMVEAYPTGEDGVQNYGTILNAGSDGTYWGNMAQYFKWFGYEPTQLPYLLEMDMVNGTVDSILDENSKYHEGLIWYNKVYREGLMDPDSISMDRQTQKSKVTNMHAMVPSGTLQGYSGYLPVYMPEEQLYQERWSTIFGGDCMIAVSAKSKNIDAALEYINMMADGDVTFEISNGPDGDIWYTKDGVAYVSQKTIDAYKNGTELLLENGEKPDQFGTKVGGVGTEVLTLKGPDGNIRRPYLSQWEEILELKYNSKQMKEWQERFGYTDYVEQVMDAGNYHIDSDWDFVGSFVSRPDDNMQLIVDAIKDTVVTASWQMVYAQTDEEFNSIWDKMVSDCEALGAQEVIEWRTQDLEQAKTVRDSLMK